MYAQASSGYTQVAQAMAQECLFLALAKAATAYV
jgi:hypothetical protein